MSVRRRIAAFLQLAQEEMRCAAMLVDAAPRQSAYFCQQCAEKIARAVLAAEGIPFGPGHNLGQMAAALPELHPWREKLAALDKHSPAATRFRYPSPVGRLFDPPPADRLRADLAELATLLDEAEGVLGSGTTT
jgi:HEPN domain-containing protein